MTYTPNLGDRVRIVEEPFFRYGVNRYGSDPRDGYTEPRPEIGDVGIVRSGPDNDGDIEVEIDGKRLLSIAPECLEPLEADVVEDRFPPVSPSAWDRLVVTAPPAPKVGPEALAEAERLIEAVMGGTGDDLERIARARYLIAVGVEATS